MRAWKKKEGVYKMKHQEISQKIKEIKLINSDLQDSIELFNKKIETLTEEEYKEKNKSIVTKHSKLLELITEFGNEVKKLYDAGEDTEDLEIMMNGWLAVWKNKELEIDKINNKFYILRSYHDYKKNEKLKDFETKKDLLLDFYVESLNNKYQKYNDVDKQAAAERISRKQRYIILEEAIGECNKLRANSPYEYNIYKNVDDGQYMIVEDSLYDFMINHGYKQIELVQWELISKINNSIRDCRNNIIDIMVNLQQLSNINVKLDFETHISNISEELKMLSVNTKETSNQIKDYLFKINNKMSIEEPFDVNKFIAKIDKQIEKLKEEELENKGDGQF